jgi:hypothetical protein
MIYRTCRNALCGKRFPATRASAQFCTPACRTTAYRQRRAPLPEVEWLGKEPRFSTAPSRTLNYDGTPALTRGELAERLLEIAERGDDGKSKTGRRFYYLALSYGYIQPDMGDSAAAKDSRDAAYDKVTAVLGILRKQGRLGWDAVLDLARELDEWQTYGSPREARAAMRRRYQEDRWLGQKFYSILIVEKDTMEPVCRPIAQRRQMQFASSRGYGSLKLQHDVAEMLKHRYAKTGQVAVILFVSDLDPSGLDLERAWREALENFGVAYRFVRIGLTRDQVQTHDLERLGIAVKPSDSRSQSYIDQYGERCWEADVLPAAAIEQAIDTEIESRLDAKLWERRDREIERARALL